MADKSERGLGSPKVSAEERSDIARRGGKAAHEKGTAHEFSPEEAREAGRAGGTKTKERYGEEFYSSIGKKGGEASRGSRKKNK